MLKRKMNLFVVGATAVSFIIGLAACSGEADKAKEPAGDTSSMIKPTADTAKMMIDKDTVVSRPLKPGN